MMSYLGPTPPAAVKPGSVENPFSVHIRWRAALDKQLVLTKYLLLFTG